MEIDTEALSVRQTRNRENSKHTPRHDTIVREYTQVKTHNTNVNSFPKKMKPVYAKQLELRSQPALLGMGLVPRMVTGITPAWLSKSMMLWAESTDVIRTNDGVIHISPSRVAGVVWR